MKVVSWNIEGRLTRFADKGRRGSPEHIIEGIRRLDGDIVFLAEASDGDIIEPKITDTLEHMGYEIHTVPYEGTGERKWAAEEAPNMKLLTRLKLQNFEKIRLGDMRNALVADVVDAESNQTLRVFGVHLDDRSENNRLRQLDDLLPLVSASALPTVVMGDLNAMHAESVHARVFGNRAVATLAKYWPHARTKDGWLRLIEMTKGDTLARLESVGGLREADPRHNPTETPKMRGQEWMPSIRLAQIDHMLVSPDIRVTGFGVSRDGGSDHRAISAIIRY